jgi:hypothetical protein
MGSAGRLPAAASAWLAHSRVDRAAYCPCSWPRPETHKSRPMHNSRRPALNLLRCVLALNAWFAAAATLSFADSPPSGRADAIQNHATRSASRSRPTFSLNFEAQRRRATRRAAADAYRCSNRQSRASRIGCNSRNAAALLVSGIAG